MFEKWKFSTTATICSNTDCSELETQAVTEERDGGDWRKRTAVRTSCINPSVVDLFS